MKKLTIAKAKELGASFARVWTPRATKKQIDAIAELGEILTLAVPDAYTRLDWVFFRIQPESDGDRKGSELFWEKLAREAEGADDIGVSVQLVPVEQDFVQSFIDTAIELRASPVPK